PNARFVHIVRDPYVVFPSTLNLWKTLYARHGLQKPDFDELTERVFTTFNHLYARLEEGKHQVPPQHFHELRYEDLIADPVGRLRRLYDALGLDGFDQARPHLEQYWREHAGYQTNHYPQLTPAEHAEITRRWGKVIEHYGYGVPAAAVPQKAAAA